MKNFTKAFEKMFQDQKQKLLVKIRNEKIQCAWFTSPLTENNPAISSMIDSLVAQGINIRYLFHANENSAPPQKNLQIVEIEKISSIFPRPRYVLTAYDILACAFVDRFKSLGMELIDIALNDISKAQIFELYFTHISDLYDVYNSFADEESRRVFLAFLLGNVSARISDYIFDEMPQYFLHGFMPQSGDILIDGGAFDGSSGSMFKKYGCEVYSFELDEINFKNAVERGKNEGFVVENFGLGEHSKQIEYLSALFGSSVVQGSSQASNKRIGKLISIDEYVREKKLPRIDFIKLDVEGSELDTLKGAAVSIVKWKPRLAISAYHKPEDVFTLAKFLKSIRPDYEFAFRHYATGYDNEPDLFSPIGKDFLEHQNLPLKIPYVWESVLYAR